MARFITVLTGRRYWRRSPKRGLLFHLFRWLMATERRARFWYPVLRPGGICCCGLLLRVPKFGEQGRPPAAYAQIMTCSNSCNPLRRWTPPSLYRHETLCSGKPLVRKSIARRLVGAIQAGFPTPVITDGAAPLPWGGIANGKTCRDNGRSLHVQGY